MECSVRSAIRKISDVGEVMNELVSDGLSMAMVMTEDMFPVDANSMAAQRIIENDGIHGTHSLGRRGTADPVRHAGEAPRIQIATYRWHKPTVTNLEN